jgi:hypothetical protein
MMDPAQLRVELEAIRRVVDALLSQLPAAVLPASPQAEASRMRVRQYGDARGYASATISKWCRAGLPHVGGGHSRRVLVTQADEWIAGGGPARAAAEARLAGRKAAATATSEAA